MCMWFGCNSQINFYHFFPPSELHHYFHFCIFTYLAVIFQAPILSNCIYRRTFKRLRTGLLWICLFYLLNFLQKFSNFSYLLQLASVAWSDGSPTGDQCRDHQPTWTSTYGCFGLNLIHQYSMETIRITFICSKKNWNNRYHSQRLHQELDKEQYYIWALLHSHHSRCGTTVLLKKFHSPKVWLTHSFMEIDHEIFSTVILSLPLIQEG